MRQVADQIENPSICVVRTSRGERICGRLGELLNPVAPSTFHEYRLAANCDVKLHYHDIDEYWWFVSGCPVVTLRSVAGVKRVFELGPGDLVACVRGIEHTLRADHLVVYYQYSSVCEGGERPGHLFR